MEKGKKNSSHNLTKLEIMQLKEQRTKIITCIFLLPRL